MDIETTKASRRAVFKLAAATAVTAAGLHAHPSFASTSRVAKLFSTDSGKGRNVMFLHGWTCDSHDWSWQLPFFESRYRVVAVDLRGHGRSEVTPSGTYRPADYVADVENLIATTYHGEKFTLIGHSMGGQIAARLAVKRPDLVSAVVSIDGALGFSETVGEFFAKTARELETGDAHVAVSALFELAYGASTDLAFRRGQARRMMGMPAHVVRESFAPLFFGPGQSGVGEGSAGLCRALTVPFYHLCRDAEQATRMRPWFSHPKAAVDVWDHTGHWVMQDRKDEVNIAVSSWIDQL